MHEGMQHGRLAEIKWHCLLLNINSVRSDSDMHMVSTEYIHLFAQLNNYAIYLHVTSGGQEKRQSVM